ncbi:DMT family transporter [Pseudomonas cichorii]|uniref:DMT family transporter n=1 Tax=Pseudomonas cichorii TaxID=36746 RepID=UPI001C8A384A|nr:DMT family transporter [Pseudomonas cichorii]MBX8530989.1 DMT family transporter [Pseudomonas cichorii]
MPDASKHNAMVTDSAQSQSLVSSPKAKGVLLLVMAILIWGANWPVMKAGLEHITPVWFSTLRFASGAACLLALQLVTGKLRLPTRQDLPLILSVGLLQMLTFTVLGAIAMTQVPAGRSAVLAYTTPLWVTPIAVMFLREKLSTRQLIGTLLGGVGVCVLFNPLTLDWGNGALVKANLMLLAASFCWAMCILHLRYSKNTASAYQLAPWQMLVATIPLIALAYFTEGPFTGDGSRTLWEILIFMGPLATAFCFCAVNAASMWLSSTSMSTAMLGVPVVGLLMSVIFMGEQLTMTLIAGIMAIIGGILIVTVKRSSAA